MAPSCTVIGGPNGSGKSRIYELLKPDGEFVNADVVARTIDPGAPETVSLAAGRQVLRRLTNLVEARRSFVFETTLSSNQAIDLMRRTRALGYEVGLVFVVLASVELNIKRVAERVSRGGHDIPESTIRRRYETAFTKLVDAIRLAHECAVYDNTGLRPALLITLHGSRVMTRALDHDCALHERLADAIAPAIAVERSALFVPSA